MTTSVSAPQCFRSLLQYQTAASVRFAGKTCRVLLFMAFTAMLLAGFSPHARAAAIRNGFSTTSLAANDDGSTARIAFGFPNPINYLGVSATGCFVNNNGNITFNGGQSTYTPYPITTTSNAIIAPFFGDVDTRGVGSGLLRYGTGTVDGHLAFGATWANVGYYSSQVDRLNSFQLILIDRSDTGTGNLDIEFNYDKIQWESGQASGGTNGLGGTPARAGYANGRGQFYELIGSGGTGALLDSNVVTGLIYRSLNSNQPGRYVFPVRSGTIGTLPPVANAGGDQDAVFGQVVGLNATATYDPQALALTYGWSQTSGSAVVLLSDTVTATPTFTAPSSPDRLVFQMVASNPRLSSTDSVVVTVGRVATTGVTPGTGANVTFNGIANPGGSDASGWFEYGTTATYGSTTAQQTLGNGTDPVAFSKLSTGLVAFTTYHYRAVLSVSGSTYYGSDRVFTASSMPIILSGSATRVAPDSATVVVNVIPNGTPTTATFESGTSIIYTDSISVGSIGSLSTARAVTTTLTNLDYNTVYHFRLVAANTSGTSFGSDITFTTPAPPTVVSSSATAITATSAIINTSIFPNGAPTTVSVRYGYTTQYGFWSSSVDSGSGSSVVPQTIPITNLTPNTTYHWQVVAIDTSRNVTSYGADQTLRAGFAAPAVSLPFVDVTGTSATLHTTVNPNGTLTNCFFLTGTLPGSYENTVGPFFAGLGGVAQDQTTVITGLQPNTVYHWDCVAVAASGRNETGDLSFQTLPIPTVGTLITGDVTSTSGVLGGTINPNGLATTYYFEYGSDTTYGGSTTPVDSGSASFPIAVSGSLSGLDPGVSYHWRLVAANSSGTMVGSDQVLATPAPEPTLSGSITLVSGTHAVFAGSINPLGAPNSVQFEYGLDNTYGSATATVPIAAGTDTILLSATSDALLPGRTYHYRLSSLNTSGVFSTPDATFDTLPAPVLSASAVPEALDAFVVASVNPGGVATDVRVDYGPAANNYTASSGWLGLGAPNSTVSGTITLGPLVSNTTYHYRVVASGSAGTFATGDKTFRTALTPVLSSYAVTVLGGGAIVSQSVNPRGFSTSVAIEFGFTDRYGSTTSAQPLGSGSTAMAVSTQLDGIVSGTTYHYRTVTSGSAGTLFGPDRTFSTNLPATGLAQDVGATGATLTAVVDGTASACAFEYGDSLAYGTRSSSQTITSGSSPGVAPAPVPVSIPVGPLTPGTLYHFRPIVTLGADTVYGEDRTLATFRTATDVVAAGGDPAPGLPGPLFASFNGAAINDVNAVAYRAFISGSGIAPANNSAIWLDTGAASTPVARTGAPVPGVSKAVFAALGDPVLGNNSRVAFLATLGGSVTTANNTGIWSNAFGSLAKIARAGDPAPGCPAGTLFAAFSRITLPKTGGPVFQAALVFGRGGVTAATSQGLWIAPAAGQLKLLLRTGVPLKVGVLTKTIKSLTGFPSAACQARQTSDLGTTVCTASFTDGTQAVLKISKLGVLTALGMTKTIAPGIKNALFTAAAVPVIDNADGVAFRATVAGTGITAANNAGIWIDSGRGPVLAMRTGTAAPGVTGAKFTLFGDVVSNKLHRIAFIAHLSNGVNGLWTNASGAYVLAAKLNGAAPDCPAGALFSAFRRFVLPDRGGILLLADLTVGPGGVTAANNQGLWAANSLGQLRLLVRKGDKLTVDSLVKTVTAITVLNATAEATCEPNWAAGPGNAVFAATFQDGTRAVFAVAPR